MSLAYTEYFGRTEALLKRMRAAAEQLAEDENGRLASAVTAALDSLKTKGPLRIGVIGEFSAGKSSLIKALTGIDVEIDADVATTRIRDVEWKGLLLVDTPGVQAEDTETDHDQIAKEATVGADLVLFVVTNEFFNDRLAEHLQFVLSDEGLGKHRETALVVNKMDRESNPDEVVIAEVRRVLGRFVDVPIHLCAARKYLRAHDVDGPRKARFIRQSRIAEFVEGIDEFIHDAEALGRLTTPLQVLGDLVSEAQGLLLEREADRRKLELIHRKKRVVVLLDERLRQIRKNGKQRAYSVVMARVEQATREVDETTKRQDLDKLFTVALSLADSDLEALYEDVHGDVVTALDEANQGLEELGESSLGRAVEKDDTERPKRVEIDFDEGAPGEAGWKKKLAEKGLNPLGEGLKKAGKDPKAMRDLVYNVGKKLGKNFKPWEAVKKGKGLAKFAGKAGKAMPYLAFGLDLYLQYKEEREKDEKERYLAMMRRSLREGFAEQARVEGEAVEKAVEELGRGPVRDTIRDLDQAKAELDRNSTDRVELRNEFDDIQTESSRLIDQLNYEHSASAT